MANKLTLNLDKSVCMLFSKKFCSSWSPCLSDLGLPVVSHTKFLGIYIDEKLSWDTQFSNVILKIKRNMNLLKRSQKLLNTHAKRSLYHRHIYSHFSYCISMWGPMLQTGQINKLQKLQNKCIHLVDTTQMDLQKKMV